MSQNSIDRRSFIVATGAAAAAVSAVGVATEAVARSTEPRPGVEWRNKQPGMAYRRFGKTNCMVSEIVFAGLTVKDTEPGWRFLETGIDLGINYIDTASGYNNFASERGIANVINTSSKRDRVYIATKTSAWYGERTKVYDTIWETLTPRAQAQVRAKIGTLLERRGILDEYYLCNYGGFQIGQAEEMPRNDVLEQLYGKQVSDADRKMLTAKVIEELEGSLQRLGTDHVDVLMAPHGVTIAEQVVIPEVLEAAYQLKKSGKIRFFGCSAHNDPAGITREAAKSDMHDMVMIAYNISNAPWVEPALEEAGRGDLGIIAMKVARAPFPDRGSRNVQALPGLEEKMHTLVPGNMHIAEKAYIWALQNPNVTACVAAITSDAMTRANAKLAGRKIKLGKV